MGIAEKIMHAFDPLIAILQGLSWPVLMLMLTVGCIEMMVGQEHRGVKTLRWAVIGYFLLQLAPGIARLIQQAGTAMGK